MKELYEGHYVLAMCILADNYTCPEKAFAYYRNHIPLASHSNGGSGWITESMMQEWRKFRDEGFSVRKISEYYGISPSYMYKKLAQEKERGLL